MSPRTRREALREFKTAIAYGDNRAAVTFALARAGEQGQSLTLAEATAHTDVHQTTVRKILQRLEELGLVEETSKAGRMAFRFSEMGMTGYRAWKSEQEADRLEVEGTPPASAMYRWRVKGFGSRELAVDTDELAGQLHDAGLELMDAAGRGEQIVELIYEVDAADEHEAKYAARRAGWSMQGIVTSAERIGLAAQLSLREGHVLELSADLVSVIAAVEADVRRRAETLRGLGDDAQRHVAAFRRKVQTVLDFLGYAQGVAGEGVELPDDERLIDALRDLWATFDRAGARPLGEAFLVSEREVRERHERQSEIIGEPPEGQSWDEVLEEALSTYRAQQRLVP